MISFTHTSSFANYLKKKKNHFFSWNFAKSIFSFLVLAFPKAAKGDSLLDNRGMVCTIISIFLLLSL